MPSRTGCRLASGAYLSTANAEPLFYATLQLSAQIKPVKSVNRECQGLWETQLKPDRLGSRKKMTEQGKSRPRQTPCVPPA